MMAETETETEAGPVRLIHDRIPTPIGTLLVVTDERGVLRALDFDDHAPRMARLLARHYGTAASADGAAPAMLRAALDAYFAGELAALAATPWATGGTPFQRRVWQALTAIPPGATLSYGALAARIGAPAAVRAVGLANGANPIAIVVPCHRVIGADGSLTGYGGGLARKRWLLAHEGIVLL
jgi:methylated-DNA-[protein]-cysteine S-methyltransferase